MSEEPRDTAAKGLQKVIRQLRAAGMAEIEAAQLAEEESKAALGAAVERARSEGATWQYIASILGLESRQAAEQRFSTGTQPRGLTAVAASQEAGTSRHTLARNPERFGFRAHAGPGGSRRYFPIESPGPDNPEDDLDTTAS